MSSRFSVPSTVSGSDLPVPALTGPPELEGAPGPLTAPAKRDQWEQLRAISLRCVTTQHRGFCPWHSHPFDEICLAADDRTLMGKSGSLLPAAPNTLCHYAPGEHHGFWNDDRQRPSFWVVHFAADPEFHAAFSVLREAAPEKRVWKISAAEAETFKWLFMRLSAEHSQNDPTCAVAESAWLRLLLVNVQRWARKVFAPPALPTAVRPDVLRLWQTIQDCSGRHIELMARFRALPNYDSLRHEFTAVFGCTPRQMAINMRIEVAKNLLLESPLSIKQIADELGYARQHEFTRAFHRLAGCCPTAWRQNPR